MTIEAVKFTPEEKAYLESGGQTNPYPNEKIEAEPPAEPAVEDPKSEPVKQEAEPEKPEEEGEEEEVVDVANKEGETRRKMIAFGAYEKQRKAAKAAQEQLTKLQQELAYLKGLSQGQQPAPQQAPQDLPLSPPDKTKEPEKYLAWLETAAAEALRLKQGLSQQNEQTAQFAQLNQMVAEAEHEFVNGNEAAGVEPHPDFNEAVKYLQDKHKAELRAAGYRPHEIQQIMAARAQSVAQRALEDGVSPAERVYSLAKVHGYRKATPAPKETEADKIARQAKNQEKAGKTISTLAGGESKGLTVEMLANLSPNEFEKAWNSGEAKRLIGWNS